MGALKRHLQDEHTKNLISRRSRQHWPCELCQQQATVYCPWDEARLCDLCDAKVHSANFLVARHSRHPLCPCCGDLAYQNAYTGFRIEPCRQQKPCVQCTLDASAACQQQRQQVDVEATLSSAESCCIDAIDEDVMSSASAPSPPKRRRSSGPRSTSSSKYTPFLSQEEGLGDSEDGSYYLPSSQSSSPPRSRRRLRR
ncbi:hypothetical protein L7F22_065425 [Adiantum nelumboides]|nr:hypothetical protein [Adiantum nelumboides]